MKKDFEIKKKELTDPIFWDDYWNGIKLPSVVNMDFSFERCLSEVLLRRLKEIGVEGRVLEIGAAPGKWLTFLRFNGNYSVSGIEYSEKGMNALKKNFDILGIEYDKLYFGDFFTLTAEPIYDIVFSLGFIEHFEDPDVVIRQHLKWLKSGGVLVLGVPNFRGIHGFFQRILDLSIYNAHNTSIMSLKYFTDLETKFKIKAHSVEYLGSFEPALPIWNKKWTFKTLLPKLFLKTAGYIRKIKYLDNINSPFLSSYILSLYIK